MKKLFLFFFSLLTLSFAQAQTLCDSVSYDIINPGGTALTLEGDISHMPVGTVIDSIYWGWYVCDTMNCYDPEGQAATFNQLNTTGKVHVDLTIVIFTSTDTCTRALPSQCLKFIVNQGWVLTPCYPTSIVEAPIEDYLQDNRIFDLLGREYSSYQSIPLGVAYIKNRKMYMRVE